MPEIVRTAVLVLDPARAPAELLEAARDAGHPVTRCARTAGSALADGDLVAELVAAEVGEVVLCGSAAAVAATAADAARMGLQIVAVADAVFATGPSRREAALAAVREVGAVRTAVEVLAAWRAVRQGLGAGDSRLHHGVLPPELDDVFARVLAEVDWQQMRHRGGLVPRLVALQGEVRDGRVPIYRHPADEQPRFTPYTPTVDALHRVAEDIVGQPFNHALIQRYPDGSASIRAHADKTLDVARGTAVVNLSLGATRTLILVRKEPGPDGSRPSQRVDLPHGSLFVLGWETNRRFQHAIRADGRAGREKRPDELRDGGERISLTLRTIATFRGSDGVLVGQGARRGPPAGQAEQTERLLRAFRRENLESDFDWEDGYGEGFDVVDLVE